MVGETISINIVAEHFQVVRFENLKPLCVFRIPGCPMDLLYIKAVYNGVPQAVALYDDGEVITLNARQLTIPMNAQIRAVDA